MSKPTWEVSVVTTAGEHVLFGFGKVKARNAVRRLVSLWRENIRHPKPPADRLITFEGVNGEMVVFDASTITDISCDPTTLWDEHGNWNDNEGDDDA